MARRALVTGASRGIGYAVAYRLARGGWDVTVSARTPHTLLDAAERLAATGANIDPVVADMSDPAAVDALVEHQLGLAGELDLLVLAAGIATAGGVAGFPMKRVDLQYAVNFRAPFQLISRLLPALRAAAQRNPDLGSRIVALSSITGHAAETGLAAYGATKAALVRLCESVTAEEAEHGVSASALSPGYVDTDMTASVHNAVDPATMIRAEDLAELVVTLTRLSRWAAVPEVVVTRPGPLLHRA